MSGAGATTQGQLVTIPASEPGEQLKEHISDVHFKEVRSFLAFPHSEQNCLLVDEHAEHLESVVSFPASEHHGGRFWKQLKSRIDRYNTAKNEVYSSSHASSPKFLSRSAHASVHTYIYERRHKIVLRDMYFSWALLKTSFPVISAKMNLSVAASMFMRIVLKTLNYLKKVDWSTFIIFVAYKKFLWLLTDWCAPSFQRKRFR